MLGEVEGVDPGGAGDSSGGSQVSASQGVGGDECFVEPETAGPAGQVVGDHVEAKPGGVRSEPPGGEVVETDTVFEVADGVFDDGVAAVIGVKPGGLSGPVRDERVVGVVDE